MPCRHTFFYGRLTTYRVLFGIEARFWELGLYDDIKSSTQYEYTSEQCLMYISTPSILSDGPDPKLCSSILQLREIREREREGIPTPKGITERETETNKERKKREN